MASLLDTIFGGGDDRDAALPPPPPAMSPTSTELVPGRMESAPAPPQQREALTRLQETIAEPEEEISPSDEMLLSQFGLSEDMIPIFAQVMQYLAPQMGGMVGQTYTGGEQTEGTQGDMFQMLAGRQPIMGQVGGQEKQEPAPKPITRRGEGGPLPGFAGQPTVPTALPPTGQWSWAKQLTKQMRGQG